jgi:hypothetical protein
MSIEEQSRSVARWILQQPDPVRLIQKILLDKEALKAQLQGNPTCCPNCEGDICRCPPD